MSSKGINEDEGVHAAIPIPPIQAPMTSIRTSPDTSSLDTSQPWESGYLRFKFVLGGSSRSPWEDFQSQRKIHGVIGICHCPHSPDIAEAYEDFMAACKAYPSAQARRCFAFDPSDAQVEQDDKQKKHLILFPWADPAKLSFLLATILQDFAADVLMGLESWVVLADRVGATLTTHLDSPAQLSAEEVSKSTKRRKGRMQKSVGDYCQLAGSPRDAHEHYLSAIEMAKGCGDHFWHAGALEGMTSAIVVRTAGTRWDGMGWDGMGWDGVGWDGVGWGNPSPQGGGWMGSAG